MRFRKHTFSGRAAANDDDIYKVGNLITPQNTWSPANSISLPETVMLLQKSADKRKADNEPPKAT